MDPMLSAAEGSAFRCTQHDTGPGKRHGPKDLSDDREAQVVSGAHKWRCGRSLRSPADVASHLA